MRIIKRALYSFLAVVLMLIMWGYFNIWRSPKYYLDQNTCKTFEKILTMEQYGQLSDIHERPYIFKNADLLIYGSEHTKNDNDPQINSIDAAFNEFNPSVVLVEGRLGFLIPYIMNPVKKYGEMGKVAELAKRKSLPLYSWEIPKSELLNVLQDEFTPEQIALKEILNPYFSNLRYGRPDSPEKYVEQYLTRAEWLGAQNEINTVNDIDSIWRRDFAEEADWREISDQWGLPGYLAEIADQSNYIRNQHLVCIIDQLLNQGERVFVICGSSHAVCIENEIITLE